MAPSIHPKNQPTLATIILAAAKIIVAKVGWFQVAGSLLHPIGLKWIQQILLFVCAFCVHGKPFHHRSFFRLLLSTNMLKTTGPCWHALCLTRGCMQSIHSSEPSQTTRRSLPWLLAAQAQVVFNDNAAKLALIGLIQFPGILTGDRATQTISLIAGLLVLPFILFAPLAGWVADRYPKRALLNGLLIAQIVIIAGILTALWAGSLAGAVAGFALLALQSCFFSPAKQGILKELVGESRLGVAVGWMEMLGTGAILAGSVAGAWAFDRLTPALDGNPWHGAMAATALLGAASVAAFVIFQPVRSTRSQSDRPFRPSLFREHFRQTGELWRARPLRLAALGNAFIFSIGGVLYLTLVQYGRELHGGGSGSVTETGILFALLGFGVAAGSLTAAFLSRRRIELGLVPVGSIGLTAGLAWLGLANPTGISLHASIFALGLAGGLFVVPVNAWLQAKAPNRERGRVIAASNLLANLGGIGAVLLQYLLGQTFGLSVQQQFLFLTLPAAGVTVYLLRLLPDSFLSLVVRMVARQLYPTRVRGLENLPEGGALLLCNHVSYLDAVILQTACPRPIRFVAFSGLRDVWWLRICFRLFSIIPIAPNRAKDGLRTAAEAVRAGELVCVFPEGALTRTGALQAIRKGYTVIARQAGVPVVPVWLDGLWGSIFSFSGNRFFHKWPGLRRRRLSLDIGQPLTAVEASPERVREELLRLGHDAFEGRPELENHLGRRVLAALKQAPWKTALIDRHPTRRSFRRGILLGLTVALARRWQKEIPGARVGIALPPGIGGAAANLGCLLAGKTPVNLNITAGPAAFASALRQAGIQTVLTAPALRDRFPNLPWPDDTRDIAAEIQACGKFRILAEAALTVLSPAALTAGRLGLPRHGGDRECALLFTSGSSGEPKGVPLTHRNLLGNISQINATNFLQDDDRILGTLPLFHSFGFTVTFWTPLLRGLPLVTFPSPLEVKKSIEAIRDEKATVLTGTATFLRPYLKKADKADLTSLRLVVAGAEKLPPSLADAWTDKFGQTILEGYGLTETAPCLSVNMPDAPGPKLKAANQITRRAGAVGRLLPGVAARLVHPETGAPAASGESGVLQVRGPNIFGGYLGRSEAESGLRDGWFHTGDLVRFDDDGFLHIEGRLSRFSKIAGEMVPHGTVEESLLQALGESGAERQPLAVVGLPDEDKGEALVLLSALEAEAGELKARLSRAGLPNLWVPRRIVRVPEIPFLGSGKLDLKRCRELAESAAAVPA